MATVRVCPELIAEWLFKGLDVRISGGGYHRSYNSPAGGWFEFEIEGADVPDCKEARVLFTQYREPGDDPHTTVEIEPADTPPRIHVSNGGYRPRPYGSAPSNPPADTPNMGTAGAKPSIS